ncbi:bifunctional diaminohydroxyphosphoribosylaminopyrimidine deaminase/5-amino-6-(5-phosphoribosylamino)uracil reductase RibD [Alkalilimnicola sp. S0819]|nr:bifunctional diaminohydroxyphosphoribosylaminopyrimidine deaminase/5-amino-6-(5-phosphoribosylamino)uracil reductase RibD [Alkalilimnicola sp. S0819]MPQ17257.1 bifunctional diaminohydroxyphosphoribosylaminopyrimidine deaminase/5-amino-6-(5-phosphoribosylamino)uracil reductase RibD [Alkalilimnicola sp. S0819]
MAHALQLAERGLYGSDPNPRVGCVLVRDAERVGEGWHARAGEAHAEVHALRMAGERARGATAYVTLEPCAHHGRTPPCAEALIEAGVARVVAAMVDPNPQVAGKGLARLAESGIDAQSGLLAEQAEALNPGFARRMRGGRPWVRVKLAGSLDGRTAMASGESQWITGVPARRDVHRLRARSSVVLTGVGTVLADNPRLNVRDFQPNYDELRQPRVVVLDSFLRTPPAARVAREGALIFYSDAAPDAARSLSGAGAELRLSPGEGGQLDLAAVLEALAQREYNEVMVEAGPTLAGAFVQAGLVDELILYQASHLMGHEGRPLLTLVGLERMNQRLEWQYEDVRQLGADLRLTLRPKS